MHVLILGSLCYLIIGIIISGISFKKEKALLNRSARINIIIFLVITIFYCLPILFGIKEIIKRN